MKRLLILATLAGATFGCASGPAASAEEPAAEHALCATWVSSSFDDSERDPCVPRDRLTDDELGAVERAMRAVTDTMKVPPPVCPADPALAERWQQTVAEWLKAKAERVLGTQRELEQLASFDVGFTIGAGSLGALYEHYALQALAAPRPNGFPGDSGAGAYREVMLQLFGPWAEKAREAYQSCTKRAVAADITSWADFCRSRQGKLEANINLARARERCPDSDPLPPQGGVDGIFKPEAATVQRDVTAANRASYSGDVDGVLRYTHAAIIPMLGGPEKARQALSRIARDLGTERMKIESHFGSQER